MTKPIKAVFLSYASEDAEATQRISETLRAAGVEVWFDRNELRGGDAWDQRIRNQIRDCALFVPVISNQSQARLEGYFRREWKLAADRTHDMADEKPFIVPVVIDDISEKASSVPETFRGRHWTRLPEGRAGPDFVGHVLRLLSDEPLSAVSPARPAAGEGAHKLTPAGPPPARALRTQLMVGAVIVAALVVGFEVMHRLSSPVKSSADSGATTPGETAIPEKSVAVMPFVDLSERHDQEYFSDGLAEELLDLLTQVPDLRVPARTSSFSFKGKSDDIQTIARKLRVANVLEGSVRKAGDKLRVTVQLIRADSGYHLWSKTFDRDLTDIFKVQDEVAAAVVDALKLKLAPTQTAPHRTSSTEAYNQFLLGRQFHDRGNLENLRRAVAAYRSATVLDPNYSAAYAALAMAELYLSDATGDPEGLTRAAVDADKAVRLGPEEADGYLARGFLRSDITWDWEGARSDLSKALELNPSDSAAQARYGTLMSKLGRSAEGTAAFRKAIDLDPLSTSAWMGLAFNMLNEGNFIAANAALRRALEIQPDNIFTLSGVGTLQLLQGHAGEALATFASIKDPGFRLPNVAMAEHTLGHAKESQAALDEAVAKLAEDSADQIAQAYAWRGEKDKAFEWLDRAYQQHDGGLSAIKMDPLLANLRDDPRFHALVAKMKFPE